MYRRDYILNETRKFAALLARLLGLKAEGSTDIFDEEFNLALKEEFETDLPAIISLSTEAFTRHLLATGYSPEKLDALGQMLYFKVTPLQPGTDTIAILQKVLLIFNFLEQQHHYQTFENIGRRAEIDKFLEAC